MSGSRWVICALALLPGLADAARPTVLRFDGIADVRIGMTLADIRKHTGVDVVPTPVALRATATCDYVPFDKQRGIYLLLQDGVLRRLDIVSGVSVATERGVGIGSALAAVKRAYPGASVEPMDDAPADRYVTVENGHGAAMRFEIRAGKVAGFYAGDARTVQFTERCL